MASELEGGGSSLPPKRTVSFPKKTTEERILDSLEQVKSDISDIKAQNSRIDERTEQMDKHINEKIDRVEKQLEKGLQESKEHTNTAKQDVLDILQERKNDWKWFAVITVGIVTILAKLFWQ